MKNIFKYSLIASFALTLFSCETGELELLENPNSITVDSADPNFVLNQIQLDFNQVVGSYSGIDSDIVRLDNQRDTYPNTVGVTTGNTAWNNSYGMFANVDFLEQVLVTNEFDLPNHLGVAQVLEAYAYFLLVDHFGDVPFSQANQPEEFPNPVLDSGSSVYDAQFELLDSAIANFNQGSTVIPSDFFHESFEASNWIALANSLKLRAYLNQRLVDPSGATAGINSVLGSNIIDEVSEDFNFIYNPSSPHPYFANNYSSTVDTYQSNNLYDYLNSGDATGIFIENGIADPRVRYYHYRQTDSEPSGSRLPCEGDANYDYCYVGNLYWGRDHGDTEGLPNDGARKTAAGVYPGGGAFDNNAFERARDTENTLQGAGVLPIYLSSHTHFALAEAALTLGTGGGSPAQLLELGIRRSMTKVLSFAEGVDTSFDGTNYEATSADVDAYVTRVVNEYSSASNDGKLEIIAREQWIASFGGAIEAYNTYRRTGSPELQEAVIAAGPYPRTWRYPANEVSNNPNVTQNTPSNKTFWDNNPDNFID
ncbi:hypothetical protein ULMS_11310 [Patiriisocius marinistellae]|uniref:SusD/RagB family nutrient-binding outer membrane lipoprotein n=1 Tax=Patiriisocius marinistellae TaxID=2494560 RepID=A0A5J4FUU5_9FLAO|nr:SusD/RagB family nutrient-binding outer membrane lipoprotein [Patiriisocius marinistellae]GEQ85623.1 hypothetical protein ULMS_11310 [Patiriisocius marinistellae]